MGTIAAVKKTDEATMRVTIAKDVIASLKTKKFKATPGEYALINLKNDKQLQKKLNESLSLRAEGRREQIELQDVLKKRMRSCMVCAKGAIFVASVLRYDKLKVATEAVDCTLFTDCSINHLICEHLKDIFSAKQLALIEYAFEGETVIYDLTSDLDAEQDLIASLYIQRYPNPSKRMIAIMQNIVDNKGEFVCRVKI